MTPVDPRLTHPAHRTETDPTQRHLPGPPGSGNSRSFLAQEMIDGTCKNQGSDQGLRVPLGGAGGVRLHQPDDADLLDLLCAHQQGSRRGAGRLGQCHRPAGADLHVHLHPAGDAGLLADRHLGLQEVRQPGRHHDGGLRPAARHLHAGLHADADHDHRHGRRAAAVPELAAPRWPPTGSGWRSAPPSSASAAWPPCWASSSARSPRPSCWRPGA